MSQYCKYFQVLFYHFFADTIREVAYSIVIYYICHYNNHIYITPDTSLYYSP